MGYAPPKNGKQLPITPWLGSWAQRQERRRTEQDEPPTRKQGWPLGWRPSEAVPKHISQR